MKHYYKIYKMRNIFFILAAALFAAGCSDNKAADKKPPIVTKTNLHTVLVEARPVEQSIKLPAQLAAYQEVSIFPKVNGYVKTVSVDIGSHVKAGQLLMTLEDPELLQAVLQAKEKYAQALSQYTISRENYQRLLEASATPGAISPMDLSTAKAKAEADSALSNSQKASWQAQIAMQDYLRVTAPFTGVITTRNVHPGALVDATNKSIPMLELKQLDHLRLQVDIPEAAAATLRNDDTLGFYLSALPGQRQTARISRKSDNINLQYRSERVEADLYNKDNLFSPGMYADVIFESKGTPNAVSVPINAVVTSTERKYISVIRDGKTVKVDVTTGNQGRSRVEIIGAVKAGEKVIAPADDEIKENISL
jgi:membrane fusion protein (multidrug efflux system)